LGVSSKSAACRGPFALTTEFLASPNGLFNLSKLSVWWLRLGISIEHIKPGHPQQNGRHERMHLTLKQEATRPAGANILQQQAKFDDFVEEFNHQRPHEALAMQCPAELYTLRLALIWAFLSRTIPFTTVPSWSPVAAASASTARRSISALSGRSGRGRQEVEGGIWLVSFMDYDLGISIWRKTLQPLNNPFGPDVSPMS
jgi:hypothetical protein